MSCLLAFEGVAPAQTGSRPEGEGQPQGAVRGAVPVSAAQTDRRGGVGRQRHRRRGAATTTIGADRKEGHPVDRETRRSLGYPLF